MCHTYISHEVVLLGHVNKRASRALGVALLVGQAQRKDGRILKDERGARPPLRLVPCTAEQRTVRRGCQGEAEGRSSSRGLRQVRAPSHNRVQCAHQGDAVRCMGVAFGVHAACSMRMRYSCPISLVWQAWSATSSTSDQHAGG